MVLGGKVGEHWWKRRERKGWKERKRV